MFHSSRVILCPFFDISNAFAKNALLLALQSVCQAISLLQKIFTLPVVTDMRKPIDGTILKIAMEFFIKMFLLLQNYGTVVIYIFQQIGENHGYILRKK